MNMMIELLLAFAIATTPVVYDVPLTYDEQQTVISVCETYDIAPEIAFAVMEKESNYNAECVGDSGNSLGIMQIQPRWNEARMKELNCNDLLDFTDNITVGISLLSNYIHKYGVEQGLVCYNMGEPRGSHHSSSEYSRAVLKIAERIEQLEDDKMCEMYASHTDIKEWMGVQLPCGYPFYQTLPIR